MRAGRLRHRLLLQQPTRTQSATGAITTTWATTATVWGAVEPLRGQEWFDAQQMSQENVVRIVIRYSTDWSSIDHTWRVKDVRTGVCYDITSVIEVQLTERPTTMLEIMATRGKTDDE